MRASVIVGFPQKRTFKLNSVVLIWRILCAVLGRYFCNRIPLQITRRPFCYSVSDRYQAFISANPMWKYSFYIILISPNRHHRRYIFMSKCYVTPVTQHWCCNHWKHCYIDRDLTLFCYLVHGIPLMKSSKEHGFRFVRGTIGHRWIPPTESQQRGFIFCISQDKRLNKRSDCQWFETIGCSLWRYCNVLPNMRQRCNFLFKSCD